MDLKKATALALFGSIAMILVQLLYTIISFVNYHEIILLSINIPVFIPNALLLIAYVFLFIFFSNLYSRQNREG